MYPLQSCMILSALRSSSMHSLIYMFFSKSIPLALILELVQMEPPSNNIEVCPND